MRIQKFLMAVGMFTLCTAFASAQSKNQPFDFGEGPGELNENIEIYDNTAGPAHMKAVTLTIDGGLGGAGANKSVFICTGPCNSNERQGVGVVSYGPFFNVKANGR